MSVDARAPELVVSDFVTMMNAAEMCVLVHDAETKNILWANPAACAMLGFDLDEIRPLKADDMSSSAQQYDRVIGRAWLQDAVEHGTSRIEWHYRSKTGRVIPTDAVATRIALEQGPAVMVQFRDIEHEQRTERALRLTTTYVDALARHTSTMAFVLDEAGEIRFATDTALTRLGLDPAAEPPAGPRLTSYAHLHRGGRRIEWDAVAKDADPVASVRLEVGQPAGMTSWLDGSLERLDEAGVTAFLMLVHDVSDRVRDEEKRGLELQRENYLARYNVMGDMAMAIAHELGQPLAAAGNYVAGIRSHLPGGDLLDRRVTFGLDAARKQIDRAATIVATLRAFVGHLEQVEQVADLNDIVAECLYFVRLRAEQTGVRVELNLSPAPVDVRCERVLTGQVIVNLCFNAIDEMAQCPAEARRILLTTEIWDDGGCFTVRDHGRGVPRDPFLESFTSKSHGSGIGLALSYRIITRQHGTIWCRPADGGGSVFGFVLPAP
ncbi:PAS domain-containing sensor histidine kinase [Nocardia donostiensis]|uniref:histidine kinase n=1 Tax=Nocardia donostiensis TaxID=1538463 RepID=A0A1W0B140_9NOCA|nr:PAS domain-containing sensor histidine kinase [Nocardia donostiensis]ONM46768.1 PAS domain-containing sensor histidine kinase [Nocardia donostiensis]OQS16242.1 PAS domain-containing sensor histidine kinase [Nocardia donostiensis]OQS19612.1 PAS domain-containing sensor histidine kinase [Nocardia donostiensis]